MMEEFKRAQCSDVVGFCKRYEPCEKCGGTEILKPAHMSGGVMTESHTYCPHCENGKQCDGGEPESVCIGERLEPVQRGCVHSFEGSGEMISFDLCPSCGLEVKPAKEFK